MHATQMEKIINTPFLSYANLHALAKRLNYMPFTTRHIQSQAARIVFA